MKKIKNFENYIKESSKVENSYLIKCYNLKMSSTKNCLILVEDSNYIVGAIEIFKFKEDYRLDNVVAVKGYGPLVYEYCLNFIYPNYLGSYNSQTKDATNIWNIFKERSLTESNIKIKEDLLNFRVVDFMISGTFKLNKILECPDNVEYYLSEFQNQLKVKKVKI